MKGGIKELGPNLKFLGPTQFRTLWNKCLIQLSVVINHSYIYSHVYVGTDCVVLKNVCIHIFWYEMQFLYIYLISSSC
jgi:hypothetical protein